MEAVFMMKGEEFNEEIVDSIRSFLSHVSDADITVAIKESEPIYSKKLLRLKIELERGENLISFTMTDFEAYNASKSHENNHLYIYRL